MNNFAISSDGIASGLSRSASTLVAAGNSLEESIAMLAAGNKVQQDPEGLGNALKVLSMRIRGTKTDLEEAGEETEGMIENTSKLRDKVKALTNVDGSGGVDILTDTGAYKSTYQILLEIAEVWDRINDADPKNQAALLEILAGKTRGSQVASILQNPEDLKDAYEMALNSDGSAQQELDTYLDSIQGRIDLFTNELQTFWTNLINSNVIKLIVDAGTSLLEVLNNIMDAVDKVAEGWGSLGVIIPTVIAGFGISAFKSKNNIENIFDMFTFIKNLKPIKDSLGSIQSGLNGFKEGFANAGTGVKGFTGVLQKLKGGFAGLISFINPATLAITGIVVALGAAIVAYRNFGPTYTKYSKDLEKSTEKLEEYKSEIEAVNSELKTTQERIEALENKDTLTFAEEEELTRLKEINAELEREKKLKEAIESREKEKQAEAAVKKAQKDTNLQDRNISTSSVALGGGYGSQSETYSFSVRESYENALESSKKEMEDAKARYESAEHSGNEELIDKLKKDYEYKKNIYEVNLDSAKKESQRWEDEYGDVGYFTDPTTEIQKAWDEEFRKQRDYDNKINFITGVFGKSDILNDEFGIYGSDAAQSFIKEFEAGIAEGKDYYTLIEELLEGNSDYSDLFNRLFKDYNIAWETFVKWFASDTTKQDTEKPEEKIKAAVTSIDALTSSIESYKSALDIVNSITSDGQAISEEYYTALKDQLSDVTVGSEGFSDAIDTSNGYIIKNASLLQKLVNQSKKAQKATIEVAKAQARSQYKNIVKQIQTEVKAMHNEYKAYGFVTDATLDNINAMQDQLDALKQTIKQYTLLELELSNATNGYREFEAAKELDSKLSYGDSMIEMIQTINDGLVSGKVGTEAFQAAVKALVPESVYQDLDNMEDKMKAIHDYLDKDSLFADYFTIDEDGNFSIAFKNIKWLVDDFQKLGIFTGDDASGFSLSADIGGMDDILAKLKTVEGSAGLTQEALVAMISELSKYDARWSNILEEIMATPLDREIIRATDEIDAATKALETFWSSGEFNQEEYDKLLAALDTANKKLETAQQNAQNNAREYNVVQAAISSFRGELSLTDDNAQGLADSLKEISGLENLGAIKIEDGQLKLTESQIDLILQKLGLIEKPTIMHVQTNYDTILQQIEEINSFIKDLETNGVAAPITVDNVTITNKEEAEKKLQELIPQKNNIEVTYGITESSSEEQKSVLESYQELAKNGLEFSVTVDVTDANQKIDELNNNNPDNKEVVFAADATTASDVIKGIADQLSALPDDVSITIQTKEKKTIFETVVEAFTGGQNKGKSNTSSRQNSMFATGSNGLKTDEHNAIVGELGRELVCDVDRGVYYTVGENGTERIDLPKNAIIYNHKQTEELLKKGHTSRGTPTGGLSFANGNAHWDDGQIGGLYGGYVTSDGTGEAFDDTSEKWKEANDNWLDASSDIYDAADSIADAAEEFEDTINWIEVLFNRIDNTLSEHEAYMATIVDSTGGLSEKNSIYESIFGQLYSKASYSRDAANYYRNKAAEAMAKLPVDIQNKIKNGTIDIQEFKFDKSTEGLSESQQKAVEKEREAFEKRVEQINEAIEYYDKISEYEQQYWNTLTEIADKAVEHLEEVAQAYENEIGLVEHLNNMLESHNDLLETREGFGTKAYYEARIEASEIMLEQYEAELIALKAVLEAELAAGRVKVGDQQWFDMQQAIFDVEDAIIDMEISIEELQNSINDLHWDRFDELINRFGYLEDEISNIVQLLSHDVDGLVMEELGDLTTDNWATDSGLATIGLYAQEMERAQYVAKQYAEAIEDLKKDYAAGKYNETEYLSKLNELISAQYENIEKYYDAKDAIIELNEARVDAIRDGIEKEINAYQELIDKKKELLNREKDLHDFQNDIQEKEKSVADLRKQLAAMAGDDTAAGVARRKQLEEQLIEAQKALEDSYYDHSMTERQNALDREFEAFEEEKNKEIEKWEEWLTETEQVVTEALDYVKENTDLVYAELTELGSQYGLTLSDTLTTPWYEGQNAIDNYSINFEEAKSNFVDMLDEIVLHWQEVTAAAEEAARQQAAALQSDYNDIVSGVPSTNGNGSSNNTPKEDPKPQTPATPPVQEPKKEIVVGGKINAGNATIYADSYGGGGGKQYYRNDPIYVVLQERNGYLLVRHHKLSSGYTGWFKKSDVKAYAHGLGKAQKDHWAMVNELGAELQLIPGKNGNLEYVKYGTSILPHDVSAKLVDLANDPTSVFDDMKTNIKVPNITSNNMNFEMHIDKVVNIEHADSSSIPEIKRAVNAQMDAYMKQINNGLKRTGRS